MVSAVGRRRIDVLTALKASRTPLSIAQIAAQLGVHANTVRFHLDTLLDNRQVERVQPHHRGPGRPPQLYRAIRRMDPHGPTRYRMLAEILIQGLAADENPAAKALEIGRTWGRTVERPATDSPLDAMVGLLEEFGFAPEPPVAGELRLRHCPFLELATTPAAVVCSIHLGLMQGALESWQAPLTVDRLEAFVEPDMCLAHLTANGEVR
ncbi:helix-turn-helix transcriptional regulator [Mycolicibacterium sp. XJ870]